MSANHYLIHDNGTQCGINHEARDFVRAMLLHLLDHLERHDKFTDFMKTNEFIDISTYQAMVSNIDKFQANGNL